MPLLLRLAHELRSPGTQSHVGFGADARIQFEHNMENVQSAMQTFSMAVCVAWDINASAHSRNQIGFECQQQIGLSFPPNAAAAADDDDDNEDDDDVDGEER